MKKISLSLAFAAVVSMTTTGLMSVAHADNYYNQPYMWYTTQYERTSIDPVLPGTPSDGWPFDDGHFRAEFFGETSTANTNQWLTRHYHVICTQQENQYGDYWYFRYVQVYDRTYNTTYGPFNNGQFQPANNGTHAGVNGSAWATKGNNSIRFYLEHNMKQKDTGLIQTAIGSKYLNNF